MTPQSAKYVDGSAFTCIDDMRRGEYDYRHSEFGQHRNHVSRHVAATECLDDHSCVPEALQLTGEAQVVAERTGQQHHGGR